MEQPFKIEDHDFLIIVEYDTLYIVGSTVVELEGEPLAPIPNLPSDDSKNFMSFCVPRGDVISKIPVMETE